MNTELTLEGLAAIDTDEVFDIKLPITVTLTLDEVPTPSVVKNLARLKKLGILNGGALMAIIGQAPIDPINLMATLMHMTPGWAFSAIDFSMLRVLAKTAKKTVAAALRVDLMGGAISSLVLNAANQLTIYKTLEVEASETMLAQIQALCDEAIAAAKREHQLAKDTRPST
jgi:hypothetical protein